MSALYKICLGLVIVGALNWLLVGAFHFNLVAAIFGADSILSRLVYIVVGICGLVCLGLYARGLGSAQAVRGDRNLRSAA